MLILPAAIMAIESDDERALMTKIYMDHRSLMYKVAWNYFRSREDVDDIVSEACHEMVKHFSTIRDLERNELRAYIVTVVRNTSINLRIKRNREKTVSLDDDHIPVTWPLEAQQLLPENRVLLQETLDHVMAAIDSLPAREQDILFLRIEEGFEYEEIAAIYNTSSANIRKILERVRKYIKQSVYGRNGI